jgi:hypothetical protein
MGNLFAGSVHSNASEGKDPLVEYHRWADKCMRPMIAKVIPVVNLCRIVIEYSYIALEFSRCPLVNNCAFTQKLFKDNRERVSCLGVNVESIVGHSAKVSQNAAQLPPSTFVDFTPDMNLNRWKLTIEDTDHSLMWQMIFYKDNQIVESCDMFGHDGSVAVYGPLSNQWFRIPDRENMEFELVSSPNGNDEYTVSINRQHSRVRWKRTALTPSLVIRLIVLLTPTSYRLNPPRPLQAFLKYK